jgi:hypothetical protein
VKVLRSIGIKLSKDETGLSSPLIWLVLPITFFAVCFNYAVRLNLWGDEAFSLMVANLGLGHQDLDAHHLPTYYWLLAAAVRILGDSQEVLLRMVHVAPSR